MSELIANAAPQALKDEVQATLTQLAVGGRQAVVVALVFEGDQGMSCGALSPDLSRDQLKAASNKLDAFSRELWSRARTARS